MNKFNVGDWVVIHPRHSLRFALRRGKIRGIVSGDALPFKIEFSPNGQTYGFSYEELITEDEFNKDINKKVNCYYCGKDITGQFSLFCEDCEVPIEEE